MNFRSKYLFTAIGIVAVIVLLRGVLLNGSQDDQKEGKSTMKDINDIVVLDNKNEKVNLSEYNGKVLLIVNVASECGYTPQYSGLQELYAKYNEQGFEVLAFPCNDFGGQEPGTNDEIERFCSSNYAVTFKLFDKVKILGEDKSPLYKRLTNNAVTEKADVKWNFEKYLIAKNGEIVAKYSSGVKPMDIAVTSAIEIELTK